MSEGNSLFTLAFIAMLISAVAAGYSFISVNNYKENLVTGYGTSTGTVNLSVETLASVNFTTDNIDFGSGRVDEGGVNATLDTDAGTVTGGNWTANSAGFVLENIGNVNVTLDLATGKTAATFIGGTNPSYQYKVNDVESGSCTGGVTLDTWYDVNATSPGTRICGVMGFADSADTLNIDVKLVVPSDSYTGALSDTFTATFAAA